MTERAKYPTIPDAAAYLSLAERSEQAAEILQADHGPHDPLAITERRFAAYYRRRAEEARRAAEIAAVRANLRLTPSDRAALARRLARA